MQLHPTTTKPRPISLARTVPRAEQRHFVTPEDREKAVAELPSRSVPELERIVTSAIRRALGQQLAELEEWAKRSTEYAMGRGKNGKGRNEAAVRIHDEWAGQPL